LKIFMVSQDKKVRVAAMIGITLTTHLLLIYFDYVRKSRA